MYLHYSSAASWTKSINWGMNVPYMWLYIFVTILIIIWNSEQLLTITTAFVRYFILMFEADQILHHPSNRFRPFQLPLCFNIKWQWRSSSTAHFHFTLSVLLCFCIFPWTHSSTSSQPSFDDRLSIEFHYVVKTIRHFQNV